MKRLWRTSWSDGGCGSSGNCQFRSEYDGVELAEGFRADLLIEGRLLVELKSVERLAPLHGKQVLTYLRLLDLPLGLLINFGGGTFKEGVRRIANGDLKR